MLFVFERKETGKIACKHELAWKSLRVGIISINEELLERKVAAPV
jgi:hypothetical protein